MFHNLIQSIHHYTHMSLDLCRYLHHSHCCNHHCKELYIHTKHIMIIPSLVPMISVPRPPLCFVLRFVFSIIHESGKVAKNGQGNTYDVSDVRLTQSEHRGEGPHSNNKLDFMIESLGKTPDVHKIVNTPFHW